MIRRAIEASGCASLAANDSSLIDGAQNGVF